MYLKPMEEINGTMEAEILVKERLSVKGPYFHINNLPPQHSENTLDTVKNVYRLFKMNRLMNHLHI